MTRTETCDRIEALGIVPVIRVGSAGLAMRAVEALAAAGISVVEITMTVPDAIAVIASVGARFGSHVLIGAGTVTSADEARRAVGAGAQFVVSPGFDVEVVEAAHALDVLVMPGALTPTEIMAATRAGADWVKIFPCSALGGPAYLRALRGPFPHLKMMPTGGVNAATASAYIEAGAAALGVGSELVDPALLEAGRYESLRERALTFVTIVRAARSKALASDITQSPGQDPAALTPTPARGLRS
jgi:2-dehydro-3-deoxyphosphogluconate aldolase / (4S)-4-hydroxy-2-oxoglutarate aldolase